mmetsp:Transcript_6899/g.14893  ORF Transcript_6899/g.14893 Transcript_6899/m.14893 type:complete len:370 (-) Transcript_6899:272-1381(-)
MSCIDDIGASILSYKHKDERKSLKNGRDWNFYMKHLGIQSLRNFGFYVLISVCIELTLGWDYAFPQGQREDGAVCHYINPGMSSINTGMCNLRYTLKEGFDMFRVLVAFILGGYVSSTIFLWRIRRTSYLRLCGGAREMIIRMASLVPQSKDDEKISRKNLLRWIVLGFELSVLKARDEIDSDRGRQYLECLNLLKHDEWEKMVNGDRHTTVWFWVLSEISKHREEGTISNEIAASLIDATCDMRDRANDLMSRIDRDQVQHYSAIVGLMVHLNLILLALWKGVQWAIWFRECRSHIWRLPDHYIDILIFLIYSVLFSSLYEMSQHLNSPFGARDCDIPHKNVGSGIRRFAQELESYDYPLSMKNEKVL